jgi:4-hydroxy-tetrahydrodipicolinate reductase
MTRIILNGCCGRLGTVLCRLTEKSAEAEVVAGIDVAEHADGLTFPTYSYIFNCEMPADVVVSFSNDLNAINDLCRFGVERKLPIVVCTTGLTDENRADLLAASAHIAVFQSANMSVGINLISAILQRVSKLLYDTGFDIEITERHHNQKLDAPSGTALGLADAVNEALDKKLRVVTDRSANRAKRERDEIGVTALRGGCIVGEHSVVFAGRDEVIELSHSAYSREIFAVGALKAAAFMKDKPPGMYNMQDLFKDII